MEDSNGRKYYTLESGYFDPIYSFILQIITEVTLILCYSMKIDHYNNKKEKIRIFWVKVAFLFFTVISSLSYITENRLPLHNIFFMLFLSHHK